MPIEFDHDPDNVFSVDFETYYDDECSVKTLAPQAYVRDDRFDAYLVTITGPNGTWAGDPEEYDWNKLAGKTLVSHNAAFDKTVYEFLHESDPGIFPSPSLFREWNCSANLCAFLCNRRSLAQAWEYLYGVSLSKAVRTEMKGQRWDQMTEPFQQKVIDYAISDSEKCRKIWIDFVDRWSDVEREVSLETIEGTLGGIAVNLDLVEEYRQACSKQLHLVEITLPWMAEGRGKPTSPKAIRDQCRRDDINPPPVKYTDEEGYQEWEDTYKDAHPWVAMLGDWRQVNKALKTLETIQARVIKAVEWVDGKPVEYWCMDVPMKYFGAHTGRWSGDAGVNFQNFRKKPLEWGDTKIDIRAVFIPRPGHKFIIADYSQIEPRCLAWLSGDEEFLQMVRDGWSVYEAHARACMGWEGENLKETDKTLYALAKASRLGLGYGCGKDKFQVVAKALADLDLTIEECEAAVYDFRDKNKKVTNLWKDLHRAFAHSQGTRKKDGSSKSFDLVLPSGRMIKYPRVKTTMYPRKLKPGEPKPKNPSDMLEARLTADIGGKRLPFYGGKLCENLTQATARDVFVEGFLRVRRAGYTVPFHVHDELIVEVPEDTPMEEITKLLDVPPTWMPDLPTEVEAVEAYRYQK